MAEVTRFEDLKCWMAARKLVKEVYVLSETGKLAKDFDAKSQFKRAALSAMNNIAEGFGKFSSKEFIRYLDIAQSSALEVKSMLYVLMDMNYLPENKINEVHTLVDDTHNLTLALIRYLRNKDSR
jgi:four helix bundle protein